MNLKEKMLNLLDSNITGQEVADKTSISKSNYYNLKRLSKDNKINFDKINYGTVVQLADLYDWYIEQNLLINKTEEYFQFLKNIDIFFKQQKEYPVYFENQEKNIAFKQTVCDWIDKCSNDKSLLNQMFSDFEKRSETI